MENSRYDDELSRVDRYLIAAVVQAKKKEEQAEKKMIKAGTSVIVLIVLIVSYMAFFWHLYAQGQASFLLSVISDPVILTLMFLLASAFAWLKSAKFKFEKAEKDYDKLKDDMAERASNLWSSRKAWEERAHVFHELEEKHNINLFHK